MREIAIKPLALDFVNQLLVRGFNTLFRETGKLLRDEGNSLTRGYFNNGYALYVFDLTI